MSPTFKPWFADLHIHVGVDEAGKWIKIPTSNRLIVRNIISEAADRKGLDIIGIADALSPLVQNDLVRLVDEGLLLPQTGGGYRYDERLTLLLGAEIETCEDNGGLSHTLIYLPDLAIMRDFSRYMSRHIRNINLSSQNAHMPLRELVTIGAEFGAVIVPAHVFTPHKSVYGACTTRLGKLLSDRELLQIAAIELGLSADSNLADRLDELGSFTFFSNSDAHSLARIGREYNVLWLQRPDFAEVALAISRKEGRKVEANYGLDPRLGKYHRTFCPACGYAGDEAVMNVAGCPHCSSPKIICGVYERIHEIADYNEPRHPEHRAPYFYQIPLQFIPGLGEKLLNKLLGEFSTEMNILHHVSREELLRVVSRGITDAIIHARGGETAIISGAGGIYGRLIR